MNKTDLTTAFEQTSFLYGGNAQFIEQLYAKYLENPAAVDQHWRQFFAGLEDNAEQARKQVSGPSWQRKDWPRAESGDLVSALDGQWPLVPPPAAKGGPAPKSSDKPPGLSAETCARRRSIPSVH